MSRKKTNFFVGFTSFILLFISSLNSNSFSLSDRQIHFPYFHGDAIRSIADFIYEEGLNTMKPSDVKLGDVVFVRGDLINDFFYDIHPLITSKYILITHNYFYPRTMKRSWKMHLKDGKIASWYSYGISSKEPIANFHQLPRGISNYPLREKTTELNPETCLKELLRQTNLVKEPMSIAFEYDSLDKIARSEFVYIETPSSPRVYEALVLHTIPVMPKHLSTGLLAKLPILFIQSKYPPSRSDLKSFKNSLRQQPSRYLNSRILLSYWINKIHEKQLQLLSEQSH